MESLKRKIKEKGEQVRALKAQKADKSLVETEVAALMELKNQLTNITGEDSSSKSKTKFTLKTPKVNRVVLLAQRILLRNNYRVFHANNDFIFFYQ